jgi:hypothetical protein
MFEKGFASLVYIIVIAILLFTAGIYFFRSPRSLEELENNILKVPGPSPLIIKVSSPSAILNWKTYINSQYNYSFKYPPYLVMWDGNGTRMDSVIVDYDTTVGAPGIPPFFISVLPSPPAEIHDINIYDSPGKATVDKVFSIKIGDYADSSVTIDLNGDWNQKGAYIRLPDQIVNDQRFRVVEIKDGYGGSTNRKLFLKKGGYIFMAGVTYNINTPDRLVLFNDILSTLIFAK